MAASQPKTLAVICPKCGAHFDVGVELAGQMARCRCKHVFELPKAEPVPAALPQHIGVSCRICGTRMFGTPDLIGRALKCPDCGAATVLKPPEPEKPKRLPAAMEGEQYEVWGVDEAPSVSELVAAQPAYIPIVCRTCGTLMHPTVNQIGQEVQCPDCLTRQVVPRPERHKRREVLARDAPQLDPAAAPGERPPVVPIDTRGMLYQQEAEAERLRQAAQRDRRGPKYDVHGRPVLPRWPLLTRVLPFLFSQGVLVRWAALSVGALIVVAILSTALWTTGAGSGPQFGRIAVIGGVCLAMFAGILGMIVFAAAACFLVTIVTESSEGNDAVEQWPATSFTDWMGYLFTVLVAMMVSPFPGWLIGQLLLENGLHRLFAAAVSVLVCFPIVLLSQLEIGSAFGVVSGRLLASFAKCPFSWLFFYMELAALAAICLAATAAAGAVGPVALIGLVPLCLAVLFLAARLLGRLAWKLAESMPAVEEPGRAI